MRLEPLGDRVLIRRLEEKPEAKSALFVPDTAKEKPVEGIVVAVGRGRKLDNGRVQAVDLQPGEHVTFGKYAGSEFVLNGEKLLIMREEEVTGRLVDEPKGGKARKAK